MGLIIYRLSIFFYHVGIRLASLFSQKAKLFSQGRAGIFQKLEKWVGSGPAPIAWFHCASLGEFEQGRPIIESFKDQFPEVRILLTFFSPSGYEVRKNYPKADFICYLPLDTKENAHEWVKIVKPKIAFLIKYEFWHFYIKALKRDKTPVYSVSSIFRPDQIYFKRFSGFQRAILKNITHFFVQDKRSKELLSGIGIDKATLSGDTRFDRVFDICMDVSEIPGLSDFIADKKVMVIGSCWPQDMEVLYPFIQKNPLKYIVAPHEIESGFIQDIIARSKKTCALYSAGIGAWKDADVLIIDNIGMLSKLYQYGHAAYVGGSFGKGLHNILEAATFALPIFFGNKNYMKFNEAVTLVKKGGAFPIGSYEALQNTYNDIVKTDGLELRGKISRDYVKENLGATKHILDHIRTAIEE